jgi:hypothetical protein
MFALILFASILISRNIISAKIQPGYFVSYPLEKGIPFSLYTRAERLVRNALIARLMSIFRVLQHIAVTEHKNHRREAAFITYTFTGLLLPFNVS